MSSDILEDSKIKGFLCSDSSFEVLSNRLKESVTDCNKFAEYIQQKVNDEKSHSRNILRTVTHANKSISSHAVISGSFAQSLQQIIAFDENVDKVRLLYITGLETMFKELRSISETFHKLRKQTKREGERAEAEVQNSIHLANSAKKKYLNLCLSLEKLRNSKKNNFEKEDELKTNIHDAEIDYLKKSNDSIERKKRLVDTERPKIANRFKNLIVELDYAMQIQLQKFTVYTESLIVGTGNQISPINGDNSMRKVASSVDVEKCLYYHLRGSTIHNNVNLEPVQFVRHQVVIGLLPDPAQSSKITNVSKNILPSNNATNNTSLNNSVSSNVSLSTPISNSTSSNNNNTSFYTPISTAIPPPIPELDILNKNHNNNLNGPRPVEDDDDSTSSFNEKSNGFSGSNVSIPRTLDPSLPNPNSFFGVSIETLDNDDCVPLFVIKCIQLIQKYGPNVEGIYRQSANQNKLAEIQAALDKNPHDLTILEPTDISKVSPEYVYQIANIHKRFFGLLPEPLLPNCNEFLKAVQLPTRELRQNKLHHLVYDLDNPRYFTLQILLKHFRNLIKDTSVRMDSKNISIIWANNLLQGNFQDMDNIQLQQSVIENLIEFAPNIFDYENEDI